MTVVYATVGFRVTLLTGIGQYLEGQGIGKWSTTPGTADTAITIDALASTPDRGIAMTLYPVADTPGTDTVMGLQLRFRGPPGNRSADKNILDNVHDALHGITHVTWGGIPVIQVLHNSGAYLGTDGNNRSEHTENYYLTLTRTGTHRKD